MAVLKVKQNGEWVELPSLGVTNFPEAPTDDKIYGRKNKTWSEIINEVYTIPTLDNIPDESVLSYSDEYGIHYFKIGYMCRVYDLEEQDYVFYQLYDINENKAVWKLSGSGGAEMVETVNINIVSNQSQPDSNLNGININVSYLSTTREFIWNGEKISFEVPMNSEYTISVSEIEGYTHPENKTFTAIAGNTNDVTFNYNTSVITVNVTSNQTDDFVSDVTLNVTGSITKTLSGATSYVINVPLNSEYTITPNEIDNFKTPDIISTTASSIEDTKTLEYLAEKITITTVVQNGDSESYSPTINITGGITDSQIISTTGSYSRLIAYDVTYHVDGESLENCESPERQTFTANQQTRSIVCTYNFLAEEAYACWVEFNENQSDTVLDRGGSESARNSLLSKFKRCLSYNEKGNDTAYITYLNETDSSKFPDSTKAVTVNSNLNNPRIQLMVYFPKYYYKVDSQSSNVYRIYFSEKPLAGYKEEPECLVGAFETYMNGMGNICSWCINQQSSYNSPKNFYDSIQTFLGNKWGLISYRAHKTIALMFCLKYGNTDISNKNSSIPCSGGTKRYDYGYPGGTMSLGNSDGLVQTTNDTSYYSSNFLGLEDCYYSKWEAVQGVNINPGNNYLGSCFVYDGGLFPEKNDSQLESAGATNIRKITNLPTSSDWITKLQFGENADVLPKTSSVSGSDSTYYADYQYADSGNNYTMWRSGDSGNGSHCGVFFAYLYSSASRSAAVRGCRLGFYGNIIEKNKTEWLELSSYSA